MAQQCMRLVHHADSHARRRSDLHKAEPHAPGIAACALSAPELSLGADSGGRACRAGAHWNRQARGRGT